MSARCLLVLLCIFVLSGCGGDKTPSQSSTDTTPPASPSALSSPQPITAAWRLDVKILKKTCNATGCDVSYRIDPTFIGTGSTKSLVITYEVRGGKDGPKRNTFTTDEEGNQILDKEEALRTATTAVHLTASVISIQRD